MSSESSETVTTATAATRDQARPEESVREIEREIDHLDETIDDAREAVVKARDAGSLASPGERQPEPALQDEGGTDSPSAPEGENADNEDGH